MVRYTISPSKSQRITPIQSSFSFNYGKATVRLDSNGTYTLLVDGSEYSEYINSARRDPSYKPTVQKVSEQMLKAYERVTASYTELSYHLPSIKSRINIENALGKLVLKHYSEVPFSIPKPREQDVRRELEAEAEQLYFQTFGRDSQRINEYVEDRFLQAYQDRLASWDELLAFHNRIQAQNAEKQNRIYFDEYSAQKEELENILNGPSTFVESEILKLLNSFQLPMAIDLEYSYDSENKSLDIEVEIPNGIFVPFEKASILSSGKISIKRKPMKEWKEEMAYCIFGLPYYIASILFNASTNIETIDVTVWEIGRLKGYLWVRFDRDEFSDFVTHNRTINPIYYITKWPHYSSIAYSFGGITSVDGDHRTLFLLRVKKEKQLLDRSAESATSNEIGNQFNLVGQGDLNPDPLVLSLSEAHILAKAVKDSAIEQAIVDAVWEGETTVAIDKKYSAEWEKVKKEVYRK